MGAFVPINMARETLISVIMSVYNGEKYLKEAIGSILNQTYTNFEFIIIDDCSSDSSISIIQSYNDPRIVLIQNKENLGLTKSLNEGLRQAKGEYIARMDADDCMMPNRLEKQLDFLHKNTSVIVVGSSAFIIDENGVQIGIKKTITDHSQLRFHMLFKNQILHPTTMFRKDEIIKLGAYNEQYRFAQDYDLWSRILEKEYLISNIEEPLMKYRLHNFSVTQGKTKDDSFQTAMSIVKRNLLHYISFSDTEFDIFAQAHHRHSIKHLKDVFTAWSLWNRLMKGYPADSNMISFIRKEQINLFRWYIKSYL